MKIPIGTALIILVISLAIPRQIQAQNSLGKFVGEVAKDVVTDPTTYGPFGVAWLGKQLDWNSSQILFKNGFVEGNSDFTVSGLPNDKPLSYTAGNIKIIKVSLTVLQFSVINNASISAVEQLVLRKYPERRKLVKTLSWVEKIAVNTYIGYYFSHRNFRQWQVNKDLAQQLGYR